MARFKAVFPLFFISLETVAFTHAVAELLHGFEWAWLFVLLSSTTVLTFFAWLMVGGAGRTSANLPVQMSVVSMAAMLTVFVDTSGGPLLPIVYTLVLGVGGFASYVYWYSRLGRAESPRLRVGVSLPSFPIEGEDGTATVSTSLLGQPVVWLFYRGNWCPLCMAQVREIAAAYRRIAEQGAVVALVSPQPHEQTRTLAKRFDVPMRFFVDRGGAAAQVLGIAHAHGVPTGMEALGYEGNTVYPTLVVTDAQGTVVVCDQTDNYRMRPEPAYFLDALASVKRNRP